MKFTKSLIALYLIFNTQNICFAQNKITVSGYIRDTNNGEGIADALIHVKENNLIVATNNYGFYSISLLPNNYTFNFRFLGYESQNKLININKDVRVDIELSPKVNDLKEVVIDNKKKKKFRILN